MLASWDGGSFLWKRTRPSFAGGVYPASDPRIRHGWLTFHGDPTALPPEDALALVRELSCEFEADFALIHQLQHMTEIEIGQESGIVTPLGSGGEKFALSVPPIVLGRYIPELFWVTILGPSYVNLFGRERVLAAPCEMIEELPYGGILFRVAPRLSDFARTFDRVDEKRRAIKSYLDENAFFDVRNPAGHSYRVPEGLRLSYSNRLTVN
jgi:hypothetical protein